MFSYQIINLPSGFSLDESRISLIFQTISVIPANAGIHVSDKFQYQNGILNIAFISDEEMQNLNKNYRGKDASTDVLSFHYFEDFSEITPTDIAGECIFSESKILSQAVEYGHTPKEEFEILLIHSILHILGFDHEDDEDYEDMWKWEKEIREKFELTIL